MIGLLDGGTTRTRLRVWDGAGVVFEASAEVGARDGAVQGHAGALRTALRRLLDTARSQFPLEQVVASGMLTSPSGLISLPHLPAPLSYRELAAGIQMREIAGIGPVAFIPGVRSAGSDITGNDLAGSDVMRGEETEVVGLRALLNLSGRVNFLHFGSHDKLIRTGDEGLLGSVTNLNGELLSALSEHTILRESTTPLSELAAVDAGWWRRGLEAAQKHGLSRAAFMVRLGGLFGGATGVQGSSFLLGALAEANLRLFGDGDRQIRAVLYGRPSATLPFADQLERLGVLVRVADEAQSNLAAVVGAATLLKECSDGQVQEDV